MVLYSSTDVELHHLKVHNSIFGLLIKYDTRIRALKFFIMTNYSDD